MAILVLFVVAALAVGGAAMAGLFGREDSAGDPSSGGSASSATGPPYSASRTPPSPAPSTTPASPSPDSTPGPTATRSPSPSSGTCDPADVVVAAGTDQGAYAPEVDPVLSLIIRNGGRTACTVNVGTSQMEFVLTRGAERVFSSIDCQESSEDLDRVIEPGGEERAILEWARNRTVPGCTVVEEEPVKGTYTLVTRLGARSSAPVTFTLQ